MSSPLRCTSPQKLQELICSVENLDSDLNAQNSIREQRTEVLERYQINIDRLTLENVQLQHHCTVLENKLQQQQRENTRTQERNDRALKALEVSFNSQMQTMRAELMETIRVESTKRTCPSPVSSEIEPLCDVQVKRLKRD